MAERGDPLFTNTQVEWLEQLFPTRCYTGNGESLEQHLLHAGKVELIGLLRTRVIDQPSGRSDEGDLSEDELIDAAVEQAAKRQQDGLPDEL